MVQPHLIITLDVDGDTTFNSTQESTNTTSGSVQVDGGVGIVKRLNVGGDVNFSSTLNVDDIALSIALKNQQILHQVQFKLMVVLVLQKIKCRWSS